MSIIDPNGRVVRISGAMGGIVAVVGMFILRLGVPLAITLVVGYWLRRLDVKWEAEAIAHRKQEELPAELKALKAAEPPCWEIKGCDKASRAQCPACKFWDIPCWAARLRATGRIPTDCYSCGFFSLSAAA